MEVPTWLGEHEIKKGITKAYQGHFSKMLITDHLPGTNSKVQDS